MVLDVPLEEDLVELVARGGYQLPVEQVDAVFEKYEFRALRRRLRELAARPGGVRAGAAEAGAGAGGDAGAAAVRARRRASGAPRARARRGPAGGGARAGGDRGGLRGPREARTAPAASRSPSTPAARPCRSRPPAPIGSALCGFWPAHAVVHDAKAQPGFTAAPCGPAFDTAVAAYLLAPERPEKERDLFALAGDRRRRGARRGPGRRGGRGHARRAHLARGRAAAPAPRRARPRAALPRDRAASRARARADGGGRRQDGPVPPRRDHRPRARPRRRGPRRDHGARRRASSRSARRSSSPRCSSAASACSPARRGKTGYSTDARVLRGLRDAARHRARWSRSGASSPSCSTPTSSRCRSTSIPAPGACTAPSTSSWRPRAGSRATTPTCRTSRCAPTSASEIRACFVAEEGHKLVVADYSQIELRLMALLSQEPALLEAYHRGEDVHRVTAAAVAGIPVGRGHQAPARARQGDQLRHHVRALGLRPLRAGRASRSTRRRRSSTPTSPSTRA